VTSIVAHDIGPRRKTQHFFFALGFQFIVLRVSVVPKQYPMELYKHYSKMETNEESNAFQDFPMNGRSFIIVDVYDTKFFTFGDSSICHDKVSSLLLQRSAVGITGVIHCRNQ
jgi:hypothetical protein